MDKRMDVENAVRLIRDGYIIMAGGFYANGTPIELVDEIYRQGQKDLTVINNDGNTVEKGIGKLIANGQVKKFIVTWCGRLNMSEYIKKYAMEVEVCPQGTFVERIRAGGFGLGGVLTATGLGTIIEKDVQKVVLNSREWLYYTPLRANVALVEAHRADEKGNLVFHLTQRNFNQVMCYAADLVIVQVNNPIELAGSIPAEDVDVPGIVVDILVEKQPESRWS